MPANHLEQLVSEWYEFQGYFVRRNVWVGKRAKGGYDCELDVVAFHPGKRHLVQIEPSGDTFSWATREARYKKKFAAGRAHIPKLFEGLPVPAEIEQIALLTFASTKNIKTLGGGKVLTMPEFLGAIQTGVSGKAFNNSAISENWPLLRMVQMMAYYTKSN